MTWADCGARDLPAAGVGVQDGRTLGDQGAAGQPHLPVCTHSGPPGPRGPVGKCFPCVASGSFVPESGLGHAVRRGAEQGTRPEGTRFLLEKQGPAASLSRSCSSLLLALSRSRQSRHGWGAGKRPLATRPRVSSLASGGSATCRKQAALASPQGCAAKPACVFTGLRVPEQSGGSVVSLQKPPGI